MTPTMLLPWQHSRLQSLSVKKQISPFAIFLSGTEGLARRTHGSHIAPLDCCESRILVYDKIW